MSDETQQSAGHIHVDAGSFDDDELIEIGTPQQAGSAGTVAVEYDEALDAKGIQNAPQAASTAPSQSRDSYGQDSRRRVEDDLPDYSIEDLTPMPIMQKIILMVLIIAVVIAGVWCFNYFFHITI